MTVPHLITIPCSTCGGVFQVMETRASARPDCNACRVRKGGAHNPQPTQTMDMARAQVIREIQAFAGDYAHPITQDGVTRDVLIVEQLIDFLRVPEAK